MTHLLLGICTAVVYLLICGKIGSARAAVYGMMMTMVLPLPAVIPEGINFAGGTIFWSDIFATLAILHYLGSAQRRNSTRFGVSARKLTVPLLFLVVIEIGGSVIGALEAAELQYFARDVRFVYYIIAGMCAVSIVWTNDTARNFAWFKAFSVISVFATGTSALTTFAGVNLVHGRFDGTAIYVNGAATGTSDTVGSVIAAQNVPLILFPLSIALMSSVRGRRGWLYAGLVASVGQTLLTFQRTTALGLAVALIWLLFVGMADTRARQSVLRALVVLGASVGALAILSTLSGSTKISEATSNWYQRVVGGLSSSTLQSDASSVWRIQETHLALASINHHFLSGTGFGVFYRAQQIGEPFIGTQGLTFVHEGWLWPAVKFGVPAALVMWLFWSRLLFRLGSRVIATRGHGSTPERSLLLALGAGAAAVSVASISAPVPFSMNGSTVVGALSALGLLLIAQVERKRMARKELDFTPPGRERLTAATRPSLSP